MAAERWGVRLRTLAERWGVRLRMAAEREASPAGARRPCRCERVPSRVKRSGSARARPHPRGRCSTIAGSIRSGRVHVQESTLSILGPGAVVAERFEIVRAAGSGATGVVDRCLDRQDGGEVALKFLHDPREDARNRFVREAQALERIDHPAVVRHVAQGFDPRGGAWLAMEWLEGETLEDRLTEGPLGLDETLESRRPARFRARCGARRRAFAPRRQALEHRARGGPHRPRHARGLRSRAGRDWCSDADAHRRGARNSRVYGARAGAGARPRFLDARADVFSLGCVLWECLTGRRVFEGDNVMGVLSAVMTHEAPAPSSIAPAIPRHVDQLLGSMLARDSGRAFAGRERGAHRDRSTPADGHGRRGRAPGRTTLFPARVARDRLGTARRHEPLGSRRGCPAQPLRASGRGRAAAWTRGDRGRARGVA